jgi:hypothetical protein
MSFYILRGNNSTHKTIHYHAVFITYISTYPCVDMVDLFLKLPYNGF